MSESSKLETALYEACSGGDLPAVEKLISSGVQLDCVVSGFTTLGAMRGSTPLGVAADTGHADVCLALIEAGATVDLGCFGGRTPIFYAAWGGHVDVVLALIRAGANVNVASDDDGFTPLGAAAHEGHIVVAAALIEGGAAVDLADDDGRTPLYIASEEGHVDVALALIRAGANVNATNEDGWSPLTVAAERGHTEVVAVLIEGGATVDLATTVDGSTPLFAAAWEGHVDIISTLIQAGANVDATHGIGWAPLAIAAQGGHASAVDALIGGGASVDLATDDGRTPLYCAALKGHTDIVSTFIRAGAKVDATREGGWTPLAVSAGHGHIGIVDALIEAGATVDLATDDGRTPLYIAATKGYIDVVSTLVHAGASVHFARHDGRTPLLTAIENGRGQVVDALVDGGANVNLADDTGRTPLAVAIEEGHANIITRLRDAGANFNGLTRNMEPSVIAAVKHGIVSVVAACVGEAAECGSELRCCALWWAVVLGRCACLNALLGPASESLAETYPMLPTLVCLAASLALLDVVTLLVDCDANLVHAVEPTSGTTAVEYARSAGHNDVVSFLVERGAEEPQLEATYDSNAALEAPSVAEDVASVTLHEPTLRLQDTLYEPTLRLDDETITQLVLTQRERTDNATDGSTELSRFSRPLAVVRTSSADSVSESTIVSEGFVALRAGLDANRADVDSGAEIGSVQSVEALAEQPTVSVHTAVEMLMSRLQSHSDGFVFTHILSTGVLGEGAFGEVSRGVYMGRDVAFKLQKTFESTAASITDIGQLAAFECEARMLSVVAEPTHRHCLGFLGVAVAPEIGIAIVTEYVSGGDLREWLLQHGHFGPVDGLALLAGLASGLVFLHEAGVVHGDIKPENILLEYENSAAGGFDSQRVYGKWIDLGGGYPYWRGRTAYTRRYGSPEQLVFRPAEAGSDVFTFGCVIMEVLSDERPDTPRKPGGPPLQRDLVATSHDAAVAEARAKLVDEIHRLVPDELSDCAALVELLVGCWKEHMYSRPRTNAVFEVLMEILATFDADRAAALTHTLESTAPPPSANSPLMAAVQYCDVDVVKSLVSSGARADEQNRWGHTPLHVAASVDHAEVLEVLLATQPELKEDKFGNTALDIAIEQDVRFGCGANSLPLLRTTFKSTRPATSVPRTPTASTSAATATGELQLHRAVAQQDEGAVRLLLEGGADVNAVDAATNRTALHVAVELKSARFVRLLVDAGAAVDMANERGRTALMMASLNGHADVVAALLDGGATVDSADDDKMTALMCASDNGHTDVVATLLDGVANIDAVEYGGVTALMHASEHGHADVVAALLSAGASIDQGDEYGWTALILASEKGYAEVVTTLLGAGATVDQANASGYTALMRASANGHTDVVTALLGAGAHVGPDNEDGWTALMSASTNGHTSVATALLDAGADVNAADSDGDTSLKTAAFRGHADVVDILLVAGALVNAENEEGATALFAAAGAGHADCVARLLAAGADTHIAPHSPPKELYVLTWTVGQTALDVAREAGHADVVALLETH